MISQNDQRRIRALPIWDSAPIPPERDLSNIEDVKGFTDVARIMLRTWPFLRPLVLGYWREPSTSPDQADGNPASNDGWAYTYVPFLVTLLAILGPTAGWLQMGSSWQHDVLVWNGAAMALLCFIIVASNGRVFLVSIAALVVVASTANLFAILVVSGWQDNLAIGMVTVGCLSMWLLQYRFCDGNLQFRIRLGCHLVYYYMLVWLALLLGVITGLFTVDLMNQSILQSKPLTPFLANFIGHPELADGVVETLDAAQRGVLQWNYIVLTVLIFVVTYPVVAAVLPYYNIWIMQRINHSLRLALVERWHQLSMRYHSNHRVGDSVYRIYQDSAQVTAIVAMLIKVSQQITQYTITVLFVAALDPILGLMGVTIAIFAVVWALWFSPRVRARALVARQTNSDLTSRIQESLGAVKLIKAHGTQETEQARFESDSVIAFNAAHHVRSLVAMVGIIMFSLAAVILLGSEFMMALWASNNRETFAAVLIGLIGLSFVNWNLGAFQWAQRELFDTSNQVRGIVGQWTTAQDMAMGLDRVFEILDIEPDVANAPDAIAMPEFRDEIRFDRVSFAYEPDRPILHDVSFVAKPGSITAIVGPTGSGKSTLVSLLTRLFDPGSGTITIDGNDLRQLDIESLRANVSIALQENVLFAMSVRDNIRYVIPDADDNTVQRAAYVACADDYVSELPEGLDTILGDRGGKLSTGQRQRLSIARALVKDAPILILDEPTAALDAGTEHQVLERLADWGQGRAIFLITHRISTIQKADQIFYLDAGEIVERGTHEQLLRLDNGRYRQFVETEAALRRTRATGVDP